MTVIPRNLVVDFKTTAELISCHTLFCPPTTNISTPISSIIRATQFQSSSDDSTIFEEALSISSNLRMSSLHTDNVRSYQTPKINWQSNVVTLDDQVIEGVCTINSGLLEIICSALTTGKEQIALGKDLSIGNSVRLSYTTNPDSIAFAIGGYNSNHLEVFEDFVNIPTSLQTERTSTTIMSAPSLISTTFSAATSNPTDAIVIPPISLNYKTIFLCFHELSTSELGYIRFQVAKTPTTFPPSPSIFMLGMACTPYNYILATEGTGLITNDEGFPVTHLRTSSTDKLNGFVRIDVDNLISASGYTKYQVSGMTVVTNNGSRLSCVSGYIDGNNISGQVDLSYIASVRLFSTQGTINSGMFSILAI